MKKGKKSVGGILVVLLVILIAVGFVKGHFEESAAENKVRERLDSGVYPFYNSLNEKEKEFYVNICKSIEAFREDAVIFYKTEEECEAARDKFETFMHTLLYEQPQYFWVNPNSYGLGTFEIDHEYQLRARLEYLLEEDAAMEKKEVFDKKVDEIVMEAKTRQNTFEQVLYVHDAIVGNTVYDHELYENGTPEDYKNLVVTAYGCLVDGKTVCNGYTLAFSLLMRELGYECGAEFNDYSKPSIFDIPYEAHVWNYCKLDGEYYYFDLTWDDPVDYPGGAWSYQYFGITKDELLLTNWHKRKDAPVPDCNGTKYNYYNYNGYNISLYSFEAAKAAILKQNPENHVALRFDDYGELLHAERDLLTDGRIREILGEIQNVQYSISRSALYLDIFYDK